MSKTAWVFIGLAVCVLVLPVPLTAATFTVVTTADAGPGSLRDAIIAANANPGNDLIDFALGPPGSHTIMPLSALPPLMDPAGVVIDGTTQPGGAACSQTPTATILLIEISGGMAGPAAGLWVGSDNNVIQGLVINDFQMDGILIEGGSLGPSANFNVVECCFIGTDRLGNVPVGNGTGFAALFAGVRIKNVPGGIAIENRVQNCLISANYAEGVAIWGPMVPGDVGMNHVLMNYIGTDVTGTVDLGNLHEGVAMVEGTHDNQVLENLISGNDYDGVGIQGFNNIGFGPPILTINNIVSLNIIGLDVNLNPLPNSMHGVAIGTYGPNFWGCADANTIANNTIAENGKDGIYVWEDGVDNTNADHNLISQNSIYDNAELGIDLQSDGVTPNDPSDLDVRGNEEMNFPVILSASNVSGTTTVTGTLDTPSPELSTVEVFRARLDPTGYGEGETYLGSTAPDAVGSWSIAVTGVAVGDSVTATARDQSSNTSEFSESVVVTGQSCCVGTRGDVNGDGNDLDIVDLTCVVDFLFGNGCVQPCAPEADVNGDGSVSDIVDLTFIVDWLFGTAPTLVSC